MFTVAGKQLHIVGGTYLERCVEPPYYELFGSGLRAACALSEKEINISYLSCVGEEELDLAKSVCDIFNIGCKFVTISETVLFDYYHPLARPIAISCTLDDTVTTLPKLSGECILYFGLIEATIQVEGKFVVYDPQNGMSFKATNSQAEHLALVLNRREALTLSSMEFSDDLVDVGKFLLCQEHADVIIIKDGPNGGLVVTSSSVDYFPIYDTTQIWPVGSGDIFSAAFAWHWMMEGKSPIESAICASQFAAEFCETQILPLPNVPKLRKAIPPKGNPQKVYLAAPFFTTGERWIVNELRGLLLDFGINVFSPYHDIGLISDVTSQQSQVYIAQKDIIALEECNVVLCVINGIDAGTMVELGYAVAKGKRVVVLAENINPNDMTMIVGLGCEIVTDIATAIYKASW